MQKPFSASKVSAAGRGLKNNAKPRHDFEFTTRKSPAPFILWKHRKRHSQGTQIRLLVSGMFALRPARSPAITIGLPSG